MSIELHKKDVSHCELLSKYQTYDYQLHIARDISDAARKSIISKKSMSSFIDLRGIFVSLM